MLNRITVQGRLVKDPELRYTDSQKAVVSFPIACDRDGDRTKTDFLDIIAWNKTAEFITKYFSKGSMILVSGRLQVRDWTDKEGNKRRSFEILTEQVHFGGDSKKREESPAEFTEIEEDGDLPF